MNVIDTESLGAPDIALSGLKIWISGRQFENATDFWDANWLVVTAQCASAHSEVVARGPIIHLSELENWKSALQKLHETIQGEAGLNCMEPELDVSIKLDGMGAGSVAVSITPDNLTERHDFIFSIDQSYLPPLIRALQAILRTYPIKDMETNC